MLYKKNLSVKPGKKLVCFKIQINLSIEEMKKEQKWINYIK